MGRGFIRLAAALLSGLLVMGGAAAHQSGEAGADLGRARVSLAANPPKFLGDLIPKRVGRFSLHRVDDAAEDPFWRGQGATERVKATFRPADGFETVTYEVVRLPSPARAEQVIRQLTADSAKSLPRFRVVRQEARMTLGGQRVGIQVVVRFIGENVYWTNGPYAFIAMAILGEGVASEFAKNLPY